MRRLIIRINLLDYTCYSVETFHTFIPRILVFGMVMEPPCSLINAIMNFDILQDASFVMFLPCFFRRIFSSHISLVCHSYSNCVCKGAFAAAAEVHYFRSFF